MNFFKNDNFKKYSSGFPCFYCGVDSTELKIFLFTVIGGLCLASLFIFIAAWLRGKFKNPEQIKHKVFEAEGEQCE